MLVAHDAGLSRLEMSKILKWLMVPAAGALMFFVSWNYLPATTHYRVCEVYSFQAGDKQTQVRLAVMLPRSGPYQEVRNLSVSWDGTETREQQGAVEVAKLQGNVGAGLEKAASFSYEVILRQGRARWQGPAEEFQLAPQPGIESDAPVIAEKAMQLAAGQGREDACRIYAFTVQHLQWGPGSTNDPHPLLQSALKAYNEREGVCGHFANLMTALCRASKIPAQSISGLLFPNFPPFWCETRTSLPAQSPAMTHGWVEFHTSQGWEMADPSAAYGSPFKSLSFGRSNGEYLSYGERIAQDRLHEAMREWAWQKNGSVAAQQGPLRFAYGADRRGPFPGCTGWLAIQGL